MKKVFCFFIVLALVSAGMLAPTGLSAQKRVIKVQGHPHELLTQKHGGKEDAGTRIVRATGDAANVVLDSIKCWAGGVDPTLPIDSAVLLIKWTDGKVGEGYGDSILAWGYRWNRVNSGGFPVHKYTIDMIRAVANADCRFNVLLQNSSGGDFVVGGFGYNMSVSSERLPMVFDKDSAVADTRIKFHYTGAPNSAMGQCIIPYDATQQVQYALIKARGNDDITGTGIIEHPFDANYGYPAYDFDHWHATSDIIYYEWQSGWNDGYWAFSYKNQLAGDLVADTLSITTRELHNHYVDGFVFESNPNVWPPEFSMSGNFFSQECDCGCNAPATGTNVKSKRK